METTARDPDPALAALVGRLLLGTNLHWRHHGIGLLQAYVVEGPVEFRLHVWHPELRFVDEDSGMIHDHRFRLESQVLLGAIHDTEVLLHRHDKGWVVPRPVYQMWEVQNARQAAATGDAWVKKLDWGAVQAPGGSPLCTIGVCGNIALWCGAGCIRPTGHEGLHESAKGALWEDNRGYVRPGDEGESERVSRQDEGADEVSESCRRHTRGDGSWWEHDARGIPLCRACDKCEKAKLSRYRPEILSGYDQSDVDESIEPDDGGFYE